MGLRSELCRISHRSGVFREKYKLLFTIDRCHFIIIAIRYVIGGFLVMIDISLSQAQFRQFVLRSVKVSGVL